MNSVFILFFTIVAVIYLVFLRFYVSQLKKENKHLYIENQRLITVKNKLLSEAENSEYTHAKVLTEYEILRDVINNKDFLYQLDKKNKIINELRIENRRLNDLIEERNNRINDLEFDKNYGDLFRLHD